MKVLSTDYSFDPTNRQVIINDCSTLKLEQFLLITNVVDNKIIYSFADSSLGGSLNGNVLTLNYNTTAMSYLDSLQIFIDIPDPNVDLFHLMNKLIKMTESLNVVDFSMRQRVSIDSVPATIPYLGRAIYGTDQGGGSATTNYPVATGPAVAPTTVYWQPVWIGPVDQRWEMINTARNTYANSIRSKLV